MNIHVTQGVSPIVENRTVKHGCECVGLGLLKVMQVGPVYIPHFVKPTGKSSGKVELTQKVCMNTRR